MAFLHRCTLRSANAVSREHVARKLLHRFRHMSQDWRPIFGAFISLRVSSDVVRHALANLDMVSDLFERMAPSVVRLQFSD